MKDKNGKPFSIKGIPVFLSNLPKDFLAFHKNGVIIIDKNKKELDLRDRERVAWHEFGEIFSHGVGLAFELDFLKKTNQLKDHLKRFGKTRFSDIEKNW